MRQGTRATTGEREYGVRGWERLSASGHGLPPTLNLGVTDNRSDAFQSGGAGLLDTLLGIDENGEETGHDLG